MFVKELTKGDRFTTIESRGTVYTCESVRVGGGYAAVTYTTDRSNVRFEFICRPLSTCTLV